MKTDAAALENKARPVFMARYGRIGNDAPDVIKAIAFDDNTST